MLQVEPRGVPLLYVYCAGPGPPAANWNNVRLFAGSTDSRNRVKCELAESEICWLEAGAVLRGNIYVAHQSVTGSNRWLRNPRWRGWQDRRPAPQGICLDRCRSSSVRDLLMLGPCRWMICLGGCQDVAVSGVRQLGAEAATDGVDIVGSRNINIVGCCLHNGDDNIAIKALTLRRDKMG